MLAAADLIRDMRFALRFLRASPGYALIAVLTLGIGIGATTLMFSLVHGALLRSLPFDASAELRILHRTLVDTDGSNTLRRWSWPQFAWLRIQEGPFETLAAYNNSEVNLSGNDVLERVPIEVVTASYFSILRVPAALGRTFTPEEDSSPGSHPVTLLSDDLWRVRLGGDLSVIGRTVRANGVLLQVVGVMPPGFRGLSGNAQLWIPQMMAPAVSYAEQLTSTQNFLSVVGRLRPGTDDASAQAWTRSVARQLAEAVPDEEQRPDAVWSATARPLDEARVDASRRRLTLLLFGAVWLVLAIVLVNLASLQVARAMARDREVAVRSALGGSSGRIARLFLVESLVLALAGGLLGTAFAFIGARLVAVFGPERLPTPANDYGALAEFAQARPDAAVLIFALTVSLVSALGFGLLPALRAGRLDTAQSLRARTGSLVAPRALFVLTALQVTLGVVLLSGAGLLLQDLVRTLGRDVGVRTEGILTFWVSPADPSFSTTAGVARIDHILERISALPGVASATVSRCTPFMATCSRTRAFVEGVDIEGANAPVVGRHYVGPDHFRTLGIDILQGRAFTSEDRAGRPRVAVVSERAAQRLWPGENPIGRRVALGSPFGAADADPPWEVIGVVRNVVYWPVNGDPQPEIYTPYMQYTYASTMVIVRSDVPPASLVPALRVALATTLPDLPLHDVRTLEQRMGAALSGRRFQAAVLSAFALVALGLAALGAYGLSSYSVRQRTRELGVRLALGATPLLLLRMVLTESTRVAVAGLLPGLLSALALARILQASVEGITAWQPATFLTVALGLAAISALAALPPALRAARTNPLESLRTE
jgi:putative ABC transport system permease protein